MTPSLATAPLSSGDPLLDKLLPVIGGDRVVQHVFRDGYLRVGGHRVVLSGLDLVACTLARNVIANPGIAVALAVPRGKQPLAVTLGLYLALSRIIYKSSGNICGSVAVSTTRTDLRDVARNLLFDGSELADLVRVARLVTEPVGAKKVRAAALTLEGRDRKGLSTTDAYLLFCLPNRMPPVPLNVISAMVCDTFGASQNSWETTYDRNRAAARRQVWLGELGDADYEQFCSERNIPLVRLDWPLIAAADAAYGSGSSRLAATACCERARQAPSISYRVVQDEDIDEELRELTYALAEMRRRGRDQPPEAMLYAGQLGNLLTRLACPVAAYDDAVASHPMSRKATWLLERITDASSGAFRNHYKEAFEQHWTTVKGAAKELMRTLAEVDRNPKYWAVCEQLSLLEARQSLRVLTQSRAERDALRATLLASDFLTQDDLDCGRVSIASYSQRAELGPAGVGDVTLMLSPPPPAKSALYLSGERGRVEVLCYPFELGRLRASVRSATKSFAGDPYNLAAANTLRIGAPTNGNRPAAAAVDAAALLTELPGYGERTERETPSHTEKLPDADAGFWESAAGLYDTELPLPDDDDRAPADPGSSLPGQARLVRFFDGPPMYFAEDADCTAVLKPSRPGEDPDIVTLKPRQLQSGMRIAVLPGSERGGLLAELMAAWDEGIAPVRARYEPMYRRALEAAIEQHGLEGVATQVGLTADAVRAWRDDRAWPGAGATLRALLDCSGDIEARRNQALIQDYFNRVRSAHRYIGRVLNDAVGETVLHQRGHDSIPKLEELVGRDLTDLFDATSVLTVESVSEARQVPAGCCGSFLDSDDPYLTAKGATS